MVRGLAAAGADVQRYREQEQRREYDPRPLPIEPRNDARRWDPPPIVRTDNPPPLPDVRPMATPVMDLKRETANHWNFTPEARTALYDTPTRVNYRGYDNKPEDEPQGYYKPPGNYIPSDEPGNHQLMVQEAWGNQPYEAYSDTGSVTWPSLSAGTLAHEFGHKWDYEYVPDYLRQQWRARDWTESPNWPLGGQFAKDYYAGNMDQSSWDTMGSETYANTIMQSTRPGMEIPAWMRDKYFVGLFNDAPRQWQDPWYGGIAPTSDVLRERIDPLYWLDASGVKG